MIKINLVQAAEIDLAVKMNGNGMEPCISDGDVVLFRSADHVKDGDVVAVELYGSYTIKHIYFLPDGIMLCDSVGDYPPMTFTGSMLDDVEIIGVMAGLIGLVREFYE